jgi:multiple sugar transport system ATP-binding protein
VNDVAFLELDALAKTYADGTQAVKGIDLHAERGEFVVLLGPSGCGKTTTLRMVAGLELPTAGAIRLDDHEVTSLAPSARDVGFVFQFYALYPHLTVAQNIAFPLECSGMKRSERDAAVAGVAEQLGLTALLQRRPRELSGGDQQRVGLARAMVRRPAIWLMDEPLGTLDSDRRLAMCEFLREQQLAARITTLYVTHDQEEAMRLADRIVVMRDGRIEQAGPPVQVYDEPASLFVAHFVGSPGMNFLEGARVGMGSDEAPVVVGIRPESVKLRESSITADAFESREPLLRGRVVVDEYLGVSRCLHVKTPAGVVVARVEPDRAATVGSEVELRFDPEHVCRFDRASGKRLP